MAISIQLIIIVCANGGQCGGPGRARASKGAAINSALRESD